MGGMWHATCSGMGERPLHSTIQQLRRQHSGNRSDGGVYEPSYEPRTASPAFSAVDDLDGWGALRSDLDDVLGITPDIAAAPGFEDFPEPAVGSSSVSCWADLPDGLLREVQTPSPPCILLLLGPTGGC